MDASSEATYSSLIEGALSRQAGGRTGKKIENLAESCLSCLFMSHRPPLHHGGVHAPVDQELQRLGLEEGFVRLLDGGEVAGARGPQLLHGGRHDVRLLLRVDGWGVHGVESRRLLDCSPAFPCGVTLQGLDRCG